MLSSSLILSVSPRLGTQAMSEKPEYFYVCEYLESGKIVAHSVKTNDEFGELKSATEQSPRRSAVSIINYAEDSVFSPSFADFSQAMIGYFEFVSLVASFSSLLSHSIAEVAHRKFLAEHGHLVRSSDAKIVYRVPASRYATFRQIDQTRETIGSVSRDVPRMLVVGLTSAFEYHMSRLARAIAKIRPESIFPKDRMALVSEVMQYKTLAEFQASVVDKEVDSVLRGGIEDTVKWFEKRCNIESVSESFERWGALVELFERRNLFVHTNGIVNDQYLQMADKHKFVGGEKIELGAQLAAGPSYFRESVTLIAEFGVKLHQVVWRKLVRAEKEKEEADSVLNQFGYELILRGNYELAIRLFDFGSNIRGHSSDRLRRMMTVNFANAHRLAGDEGKARSILDAEDWSAASDDFKICVAAVRGELDTVLQMMKDIGPSEHSRAMYEDWPVFFKLRDDKRFHECFSDIFGSDFVPAPTERATVRQLLELAASQKEKSSTPEKEDIQSTSQSAGKLAIH